MKMASRSFVSGELDPGLHYRADLQRYTTGLAACRNFIVRAQGGIVNRPGLRFIGEVKDSTSKTRLIPFEFNTQQTYILEFSHNCIRVIKDGGYVVDSGTGLIYEIVTPYHEDDLTMLKFTQSADVMTICHRDYQPRDLSRTDHDAWSLDTVSFASDVDVPSFASALSANISGITVADPAVITTATAHGFSDGTYVSFDNITAQVETDPGVYFYYDHPLNGTSHVITLIDSTSFSIAYNNTDEYSSGGEAFTLNGITVVGDGAGDFDKNYRYVVTATVDGVESFPSIEVNVTTPSLSVTAGVRLEWNEVADADYYTIYKDPSNGSGVYGFIGEANTNVYVDYNIAPDTSVTPPEENNPFLSTEDGYPGTVAYYQQRKLFGNTDSNPQTLYCTQTGVYNSMRFSRPARDDDAITFTIAARQINEIRHIIAVDDLMLLTSGAMHKVTEGENYVLTPSTIGAKPQSYIGASDVRPAVVSDSVLFVQEKGNRIRDLSYAIDDARYIGNDLSIMAEHLFEGHEIVDMIYAEEPCGVLWCVRDDGILLGLTYQKEHKVWAWHRHETDGVFESVASIKEGSRDAVYFVVRREINGQQVRYVERLDERENSDAVESFFVDSGLTYRGDPATTISGLDHLEGEDVVVLADGYRVPNITVSGGQIALPRVASVVHVGLEYLSEIETLGIDTNAEATLGRKKNVSEVAIQVLNSRGGWVGPTRDNMVEIKPRFDSDGYDTMSLKTFEQRVTIGADWNDNGRVVIQQRDPLPMTILAITPEFVLGG
jgi:hypothetical protein